MTLISEMIAGVSSSDSLPKTISAIAIVSSAFGPDVTEPMNGLSESVINAYTMSRWRESSGLSSGSQTVPPGESSCGNDCASRTRFSKSL